MSSLRALIETARPHQFLKNGLIFLPLFFGHRLLDIEALLPTILAFVTFCLLSGSVYILNDLKDIHADRNHPEKMLRPLASGRLGIPPAIAGMVIGILLSLIVGAVFLKNDCVFVLLTYLAINLGYSFYLKHFAIIDIFCISTGFVLRVVIGGLAAGVSNSHLIIIMTFLMALFIALAKRRDDLRLSENGHQIRKAIDGYNLEFVALGMGIMASVIIVAYLLYTVSPEIIQKHNAPNLYLTTFWVIAGIFRYFQITFVENKSGSPTRILIRDSFLKTIVAAWLLNFYWVLYAGR